MNTTRTSIMNTGTTHGTKDVSNAPGLTVTSKVHFGKQARGALRLRPGPEPEEASAAAPQGRVPKVARLMALAIRFEGMLERGEVKDLAELARVGHVTRARVTQVMNLLMLAPEIQEALLSLPEVAGGRDPVREWQVRPIAAEPLWSVQRRMWRKLVD